MNKPRLWLAVITAALVVLACDPKTPKPVEPPKPVVQVLTMA
ncbi:MAG: hypothetical protein ABI605_00080 [Rhizobacter sp.]